MIASEIKERIRRSIVLGDYSRSGRLPTREEFSRSCNASKATVQKALASLEDEGFIISKGSMGTFVNPQSPYLTNVAIILPCRKETLGMRNQLHSLLEYQHSELEKCVGKKLRYFYIDTARDGEDDFQRVAEDAHYSRLAGTIFPFAPQPWMLEPFHTHHLPVVALTDEQVAGASTVWVDYADFLRRSLELCKRNGCRRPALLVNPSLPYHYIESYLALQKELGFPQEKGLIQAQDPSPWLRHAILPFFLGDAPADALILTDQILLETTFRELLELGKIPGRDLLLVSQATFPQLNHTALPVHFLGFSLHKIIACCLDALEELRTTGMPVQKHQLVPADASSSND
ncbi:MAG: GntR family transcriptional regulator [Victivallales bacterium]|nr:GntR family transcriptional regulator [Victivallales bacterium]